MSETETVTNRPGGGRFAGDSGRGAEPGAGLGSGRRSGTAAGAGAVAAPAASSGTLVPGPAAAAEPDEFAVQVADQIESFILTVREVAKGDDPDSAVPYLLLEVSQLMLAGGRLGAHEDIVPDERYEPDAGPEPDEDDLRQRLAALLEPIDVYSEVFDPYVPRSTPVACRISDDMADVVADLTHGLVHFKAGRVSEALWWWQFSYLSNWGPTASASLRALQSLVAHVRLDSPLDELDGLDTGSDADDEEQLAREAGRVMEAELGTIGLRGRAR
jgi:uncharacterized protein DUF5063